MKLLDLEYDSTSEDAEFLLEVINKDSSSLNEHLLYNLKVIDRTLTKLNEEPNSAVKVDSLKLMAEVYLLSDKVLTLISKRRKSIKLESSKLESIKINAESVVNGIEKVAELNKEHLIKKDALLLLFYLAS